MWRVIASSPSTNQYARHNNHYRDASRLSDTYDICMRHASCRHEKRDHHDVNDGRSKGTSLLVHTISLALRLAVARLIVAPCSLGAVLSALIVDQDGIEPLPRQLLAVLVVVLHGE